MGVMLGAWEYDQRGSFSLEKTFPRANLHSLIVDIPVLISVVFPDYE
jgi:hypothetical protein